MHVHTTLSDGGGTPEQVIAAAQSSGLDFVALTDHNHIDGFSLRGFHQGTLVLVGTEISTHGGHILALGLSRDPNTASPRGARRLADVEELGGIAFAAHPTSPRADFAWADWELPGPWGMELLNGDTGWRRVSTPALLVAAAQYQLNPTYALLRLLRPIDDSLAAWDRLLARRNVVGIYGADAHARLPITARRALQFPGYEAIFNLASNYVLLDEPLGSDAASARQALVAAVRRGRVYIGLDGVASARGFSFTVEGAQGQRWTMGDVVPYTGGQHARVRGRLPPGRVSAFCATDNCWQSRSIRSTSRLPGTGVYRVEAWVDGWPVPWVITNPVVLTTPGSAPRDADWPQPFRGTPLSAIIDDFDGTTGFVEGHDSRTEMSPEIVDPAGGVDGSPAGRIEFRLAHPSDEHPDVFAALVDNQPRDLTGLSGLTFHIRADGTYRLWLQVPRRESCICRCRHGMVDRFGEDVDGLAPGLGAVRHAVFRQSPPATAASTSTPSAPSSSSSTKVRSSPEPPAPSGSTTWEPTDHGRMQLV